MEILKILLNNWNSEVLLNETDEGYGNTPLHVVASLYSYEFTKLLIEAGSDKEIKNNNGKTPLEVVDQEIEEQKNRLKSKQ